MPVLFEHTYEEKEQRNSMPWDFQRNEGVSPEDAGRRDAKISLDKAFAAFNNRNTKLKREAAIPKVA